jgi:hypothetical protein
MRNVQTLGTILLGTLLSLSTLSCAATDEESIEQVSTESEASWGHFYNNFREMFSDSFVDAVVFGEISRVVSVQIEPSPKAASGSLHLAFTDFEFKIERTLKGKEAGMIILHQTGAEGDFEIHDDPLFKIGEKYVLFLHKYEEGKYFVTGGPQGRFKVIGDKVYSMNYALPPENYVPSVGLDTNAIDLGTFVDEVQNIQNTLP